MIYPVPHASVSLLSFAVASVFAVVHESEPAADAVAQEGAVGASLVPGDAVGKAAVAVVAGTAAEAVAPTTFDGESVGDSEEVVVKDA